MKNIYQAFYILASLLCTGCSDFLSEYSQDMIVAKQVSDLDEVLLGDVYLPSREIAHGAGISTGGFLNILDDDINTAVSLNVTESQKSLCWRYCIAPLFGYYAWQLEVGRNYQDTGVMDDATTWNDLYHRINIANMILHEIEDLPHEMQQDYLDYLRVTGEAYFTRAQFYFMLANLYGDAYSPKSCDTKLAVPLKLSYYVEHDKENDTQFQRATLREVYDQIVSDLLEAEDRLTRSPQKEDNRLHRASLEAVDLLLSRVYLYRQDYENAEKKADVVVKSTNVILSTLGSLNPDTPFLTRDNREIIFSQGSNYLAPTEMLAGEAADYCVTQELYDMYDPINDHRATTFFRRLSGETDSIGLTNKYQRGNNIQSHVSDVFMLRKAEAYLNKAEACAMQSGKEAEANNMLNEIRRNRIAGYINQIYSGEELVTQIRNERRKELCFEGHRWFDLRRYAVCEKYPYSRDIVHVVNVHDDDNRNIYLLTLRYLLPAGDPAYTFQIPKSILEFDRVPMQDNLRQPRPAIKDDIAYTNITGK